jgi:hypothetical protein
LLGQGDFPVAYRTPFPQARTPPCIIGGLTSKIHAVVDTNGLPIWLGQTAGEVKLAANYLAFIQLASIRLWLRVNESTP